MGNTVLTNHFAQTPKVIFICINLRNFGFKIKSPASILHTLGLATSSAIKVTPYTWNNWYFY